MPKNKFSMDDDFNGYKIRQYATLISTEWRKATASILAVAKICAEANKILTPNDKKNLFKELPFKQSVFSKLATIGEDKRLTNSSFVEMLPPNYSTIYEIAQLTDDKLREAVSSKLINPRSTRANIIAFSQRKTGIPQKPGEVADGSLPFFAEIRLPADADRDLLIRACRALNDLEDSGAQIIRSTDLPRFEQIYGSLLRKKGKLEKDITKKMHSLVIKRFYQFRKKSEKKYGKKSSISLDDAPQTNEMEERINWLAAEFDFEDELPDLRQKAEQVVSTEPVDKAQEKLSNEFPFLSTYDEAWCANVTDQPENILKKVLSKPPFSDFK